MARAEGLTLELHGKGHALSRGGASTTKYRGVQYSPDNCASRPYRAAFPYGKGRRYIGAFASAEQAALEVARLRESVESSC